jgi:CheY-like chemotaxis protein
MSILIVEDNEQMRRTIKRFVTGLAGRIYDCADGAEALALYMRHRPDWVLMDIKMEGMDGISATRQILMTDPAARIIIVTSYDDAEMRRAARDAGACAYVLKDDLMELRDILAALPQSERHAQYE